MNERILYITPFKPDYNQGGGRVCYLNLLALIGAGYKISYIGPSFNETEELSYNMFSKVMILDEYSLFNKLKALFLVSNVFSVFANRSLRKINVSDFNIIFLESTRLRVFNRGLFDNKKIYTIVHNVEYDYYKFNFSGVLGFIKLYTIKCIERKVIKNDYNRLIFFHQTDIEKISKRYDFNKFKRYILPVCVKTNFPGSEQGKRDKVLLFIGSLGINYNHEGILSFIEKCMPKLSDFKLIIAGRSPKSELKRIVNEYSNVELFEDPIDIKPFFLHRSIFLNPDNSGSGMKLKVVEALSYGLPIISTRLGANGYYELDKNCGLVVESIDEFSDAIKIIDLCYDSYSRNALSYFEKAFSYEIYKNKLIDILNEE